MKIQIVSAHDLLDLKFIGKMDPFVVIRLSQNGQIKELETTVCVNGGKVPIWNASFEVNGFEQAYLELSCFDGNRKESNLIGTTAFQINQIDSLIPIRKQGRTSGKIHLIIHNDFSKVKGRVPSFEATAPPLPEELPPYEVVDSKPANIYPVHSIQPISSNPVHSPIQHFTPTHSTQPVSPSYHNQHTSPHSTFHHGSSSNQNYSYPPVVPYPLPPQMDTQANVHVRPCAQTQPYSTYPQSHSYSNTPQNGSYPGSAHHIHTRPPSNQFPNSNHPMYPNNPPINRPVYYQPQPNPRPNNGNNGMNGVGVLAGLALGGILGGILGKDL